MAPEDREEAAFVESYVAEKSPGGSSGFLWRIFGTPGRAGLDDSV
jgi:hypothetical protein